MNKFLQYVITVALICFCNSRVNAQSSNQIQCLNATSLTNLNSSFTGEWYEASRSPASNLSCVSIDIEANSSGLIFTLTSASSVSGVYQNQSISYSLANSTVTPTNYNSSLVNATSPAGGFVFSPMTNESITVKVLDTDFANYALICGYSNTTNSSFGVILTRQIVVSNATLSSYATLANATYADFANLTDVNQSTACYKQNSAASHASALSLIIAAIFVMFKFIN